MKIIVAMKRNAALIIRTFKECVSPMADLLAFTVRYYDRKKRVGKVFCCCVATSGLGPMVINSSNLLNFLLYRARHKKFTIPTK
jgi:hypothetical protein